MNPISNVIYEAAEKHYARAKDPRQLEKAIRAKLTAQAEFVFWWDTQAEKDKGGRPSRTRDRSVTALIAGENGLPDRKTISRWRLKLNDPDRFEATYEAALARYVKILELGPGAHVSHNTGEVEWYTPVDCVNLALLTLRRCLPGGRNLATT